MDTSLKAIGQRIRQVRQRLKLTQKSFARELSVSDKTVSAYEMGDISPSIDVLTRTTALGGCTIEWLVYGFDTMPQTTDLSSDELTLIIDFRKASEQDRAVILRVASNAVK